MTTFLVSLQHGGTVENIALSLFVCYYLRMIWLPILTALILAIYLVVKTIEGARQDKIQKASIDALLAALGDSGMAEELSRKYFYNLEQNLDTSDYETLLNNMCIALNITPELDEEGRINNKTLAIIVGGFASYAKSLARA